MPLPIVSGLLIVGGVALIALGTYMLRLYRSGFRSDPEGSMTRDLLAVLLVSSWAPPAVLAAFLCYLGGTLCVGGLFVAWLWLEPYVL